MGRYSRELRKIGSWRMLERPDLAYDRIVLNSKARVAIVGEIAHVSWLAQMDYLNDVARRDVDKILEKFAEDVGVDIRPASD